MGWCNMMEFVEYAFYGDVVGKPVALVKKFYTLYCKLFKCEEVDNIEILICNEYGLLIEKGVFTK